MSHQHPTQIRVDPVCDNKKENVVTQLGVGRWGRAGPGPLPVLLVNPCP
jgi:hypothetical protein